MFKEGAVPGRVDADSYGSEFEDFSQDATALDIWVFDRVKALFAEAATNSTLNAQLREDKLVFFLHLLGLDTTGHSYRPYSKEYLHNIEIVDQGVKEITHLIEDFYGDGKTAFVFTADHGMSDLGSHGDGHPDNTRTPLIAWGSGVAKPRTHEGTAPGHDALSADWGLDHVQRHDVAQADIAPLMTFLAGLAFPVNSVGELPLPFLAAGSQEKAEALLANAREILEMYKVKEMHKRQNEIRYRPYAALGDEQHSVEYRVTEIRDLIDAGKYDEAIASSDDLIKTGLQGLRYLQTYDWLFLRALVTIGYLGWIAFALTTVIDLHVLHGKTRTSRTTFGVTVFTSILAALFASFIASKSPITYYAYSIFAVGFWEEVFARKASLVAGRKLLLGHVKSIADVTKLIIMSSLFVGFLEMLALGYDHREMFSALFILATIWPLSYGTNFLKKNLALVATWSISCSTMSIFTLLPVLKKEDVSMILSGGILMVLVGIIYLACENKILKDTRFKADSPAPAQSAVSRLLVGAQIGLIILSMIVTRSSALSLQAKQGLPKGNQVLGWLVLVFSLIMPVLHSLYPNKHYLHRLMVVFLTFSPIFVILTISYEGLFYFVFSVTLVTWVMIEHRVHQHGKAGPTVKASENGSAGPPSLQTSTYRSLTLADARTALFFLTLIQSAFFSTGNMASISTFSLDSVYRLIPVFDPFSQGALLILKLLIPFALISANLGILNQRLGVAPSALFMVVMAISDFLTLYFFWAVRDEGSWLEIGSTISHFAIASLLCVFVAGLEGVSEIFIRGVEVADDEEILKKEKEIGGVIVGNGHSSKSVKADT